MTDLALTQRDQRVPFARAVRVVPIVDGPPRAYRVLSGNLSRSGIFLATPAPFAEGTKVALSLEAGGRVLPFAQGEVIWGRGEATSPGVGVKFTEYLHPRAREMVDYLVGTIEKGGSLELAPYTEGPSRLGWTAAIALVITGVLAGGGTGVWWWAQQPDEQPADAVIELAPPPPAPAAVAPGPEAAAAPSAPAPIDEVTGTAAPVELAPPAAAPVMPEPAPAKAAPVEPMKVEALKVEAPKVAAPVEPKPKAAPAVKPTGHEVQLPRSGASAVSWTADRRFTVRPSAGAHVEKAFLLKSPVRLVIDLSGSSPEKSFNRDLSDGVVQRVRLGTRPGGSRLVIDLAADAKSVVRYGDLFAVH
ncbi:MAG: PilZ domain-containing protein [Myxococcaceae bacterium]|nr:PilZ domain-containing protein [Myxococcaceae bacterium]